MDITKRTYWTAGLALSLLIGASTLIPWAHIFTTTPNASASSYTSQAQQQNRLAHIQNKQALELGLLKTPASYFQRQHDAIGFDYHIAARLAEELGVELSIQLYDTPKALRHALDTQNVDMIATELSANSIPSDTVPYYTVELIAVQTRQQPSAQNIEALASLTGVKSTLSSKPNRALTKLSVNTLTSATPEEILTLVQQGHYDYGLISRHHFQVLSPFFPELKATAEVNQQPLQWHLSRHKNVDNSDMIAALKQFVATQQQHIENTASTYFAPIKRFDLYSSRAFKRHWEQRLSLYSADFQLAAEEYVFDWQLLAAVGYQESHWDPNAVSPTGVEGLMMLTRPTAREMGVADRRDPIASIYGGSAYLAGIHKRMPESIREPDRTWMALAAYNAGYGHLLDARRLTAEQGDNPDNWAQVAKRLPLLTQPEYYQHARYGYARGGAQAVYYVEAVQHYYHALLWAEQHWGSSAQLVAMAP